MIDIVLIMILTIASSAKAAGIISVSWGQIIWPILIILCGKSFIVFMIEEIQE